MQRIFVHLRKSNQIYLLHLRKVAAIFIIFLIIVSGCRSTKYVPDDKYLLNSVTINTNDKDIKPADVQPFVKQKPNPKILGLFKFHLWIYNRAPKNGKGWMSRVFKKIGEAPIIYDENRTTQSNREILRYMNNKGFTSATVKDSIINTKRQKVDILYNITCNTPYRIAETLIHIEDTAIAKIVAQDSALNLIKTGNRFDLDVLDNERERIALKLKNIGYYDFNKNNFSFQVDTTLGDYKVKDILILKIDSTNPQQSYIPDTVSNIVFFVGYDAQKALNDRNYFNHLDTVIYKKIKFLSEGKIPVKPDILYRNNLLQPGMLYSQSLSDKTHALLSSIEIISYANISYTKQKNHHLECKVYISLSEPQGVSLELEGTNISGNFGAAINAGYTHKNPFRGAEQFSANFTIGREAIIGLGDNKVANSKELGADMKLSYPKFIFPFLNEDFKQKSKAKTDFGLSFDYQERPEYTRRIATAEISYNWRRSNHIKHQLTPIMMNYVNIPSMDATFSLHVDTTEYLKYSYQDHVIFGSRYAITFQGKPSGDKANSKYLRLTAESSGNMLNTLNKLTGQDKTTIYDEETGLEEDAYYTFLKVRYSQYVKFDAVGVLSHHINSSNTMAYRAQFGIGIPYNNSSQLPFEKRYFGGGANGVRAWMVRSLGPGTYYNDKVNYMNQSGDINFVASAEYRFKLFKMLEGALFTDIGNTWTIKDYDEQAGAVFNLNSFYKQIAAGVGAGARIDLKFFVFRVDMAFKAFDPTQVENERWVLGSDWKPTTHIAIGYPF